MVFSLFCFVSWFFTGLFVYGGVFLFGGFFAFGFVLFIFLIDYWQLPYIQLST